jgi:hypothetical protein
MTTTWRPSKATRDAFRDGLLEFMVYRRDAERAADLFVAVVGKTLSELVPEEMGQMRDALDRVRDLAERLQRSEGPSGLDRAAAQMILAALEGVA